MFPATPGPIVLEARFWSDEDHKEMLGELEYADAETQIAQITRYHSLYLSIVPFSAILSVSLKHINGPTIKFFGAPRHSAPYAIDRSSIGAVV